MPNGGRLKTGKRRRRSLGEKLEIIGARKIDWPEYKKQRERALGTFGPASDVRKIDPKTGEVVEKKIP